MDVSSRLAALEAENVELRERLCRLDVHRAKYAAAGVGEGGEQAPHTRFPNGWDAAPGVCDLPTFPERPHFEAQPPPLHPSTAVVAFDPCPSDPYHPSSMPIYQTATFVQPNIEEFGPYDYTRSGNPTRTALETLVAELEGAYAAFAFSTGMAALSGVIQTLNVGDEILACSDLYGGMHRLLTQITARFGLAIRLVDTTDVESVRASFTAATRLIHVETPSNPLMKITDLKALSRVCEAHNVLLCVDSTMPTPVRCQPLSLGAHIVVHSGTKFFSGHSDTMSGFVCVRNAALAKQIAFVQNAQGSALAPFDSWLILRGLKTIVLRVEKQEANALAIAHFLCQQPSFVKRLYYPGVCSDLYPGTAALSSRQFNVHRSQCSGPGTVLSFETGSVVASKRFVDHCKLFKLTVSFGSCNSLVEMPCALSHASIPADKRTLPSDLVRISVGIEHVDDLIDDLRHAIRHAVTS